MMKGILGRLVQLVVATAFALFPAQTSATECTGFTPSKPVHHVAGVVINVLGERIAGADVSALKDGKVIATLKTDEHGKFSFGELEAGTYEIDADAEGYIGDRFPVTVVKPALKDPLAIEIEVAVGGQCPGATLIKANKIN